MEIKQGKTVAQLVEYLYSEYGPVSTENIHIKKAECFDMVVNYVQICSTKLHKGLFIPCDDEGNEIEVPLEMYYLPDQAVQKYPQECYKPDLEKYQEAEKKVIFKGWTYGKATKDNLNHTFILDEYTTISTQDFIHWYDADDNLIKTIGDLFEYTEGQIETQNINI